MKDLSASANLVLSTSETSTSELLENPEEIFPCATICTFKCLTCLNLQLRTTSTMLSVTKGLSYYNGKNNVL